jgi:DNA modification methylase
MADWPSDFVDLVVTSPPYWTAVEYEDQKETWPTYEAYLADMMSVWKQCARVLRPNGKLCVNAPIMPVPKTVIDQHTRHIKNIAFDLDQGIVTDTGLERFSVFIWQKQTSKLMFGSYPYPGNILENNTIEFINVYVKPGKPPKFDADLKEANKLTRAEWLDLTQQVWFMYPEDVKREEGHPAPFPIKLPGRLMRLYTYGAFRDFPGEIVLDPFVGSGTTCSVAASMGRQWIGIDLSQTYLDHAARAIRGAKPYEPLLIVGRPKYPTKDDLIRTLIEENGTAGMEAAKKHKRKTYGRGASRKDEGPTLF